MRHTNGTLRPSDADTLLAGAERRATGRPARAGRGGPERLAVGRTHMERSVDSIVDINGIGMNFTLHCIPLGELFTPLQHRNHGFLNILAHN